MGVRGPGLSSLVTILWLSPPSFCILEEAAGLWEADPSCLTPAGTQALPQHSLLHDFPSLPRLKPERQRQVPPCGCWPAGRCQSIRLASRTGRSRRHGSSLGQGGERSGPLEVSVPGPEKASSSLTTLPPAAVFVSAVPSRDLEAAGLGLLYPHTTPPVRLRWGLLQWSGVTAAHSQVPVNREG